MLLSYSKREPVVRLVESHHKAIVLEPASAGWFAGATIIGAAFLLLALLNAAPV
jgi:hypothetical protein